MNGEQQITEHVLAENARLKERLRQLEANQAAAIKQQQRRQQQHHKDIFNVLGDMVEASGAMAEPEVSDHKVEPAVESSGGEVER